MLDPIAEGGGHDVGVLGEVVRRRPLRPAALVLQHLGQVPVVQRDVRLDPGGEQLVDEPVVEVEARRGDVTATVGDHPRPGDREPVGAEAEFAHQPDVGRGMLVVAAGDVAVAAVEDRPGIVQKRSQMLSPRPARPPSIWNDDVAAPHTKSSGKLPAGRLSAIAPTCRGSDCTGRARRPSVARRLSAGHRHSPRLSCDISRIDHLTAAASNRTVRALPLQAWQWNGGFGAMGGLAVVPGDDAGDRSRPVTLDDVARMSGVSRATASRALNGHARVSADVRTRVQMIADQLGYRPNTRSPLARLGPRRRARPRAPRRTPDQRTVRGAPARGGRRRGDGVRPRPDVVDGGDRAEPVAARRLPHRASSTA